MATSFIQELKRRNVFRVAIIYVVVSWLLMQVGDVMFPALLLPEWTPRMLIAFLILGLPIALIFAWAYEVTPDGIKRTVDVAPGESITNTTGRKIDFVIIGVLAMAVALLGLKVLTTDEPVSSALSSDADQSIAVLTFKNQSASEENAEFFASGVHDELITLLSKLGEIKVISRTSVERLDPKLSTTEIGTLLGVAAVLEGQVQRAGDQLRINVQLINASNDDHIWANIYDRELTASNVFEVQSDIARTIASALHAELSDTDEKALATAPTENLEALEQFMIGGALVERGSFESIRRAADHYKAATTLDANYADAWVALAHTYARMFQTGLSSLEEYLAFAEPAVLHALQIDDQLPAAHAELAVLQWLSGDLDAAEIAFKTALDLNPNESEALLSYGNYLRTIGRSDEAIPVLEKSLIGDPLNVELRFELGKAEMYAGHPERNLAHAKIMLDIDPSSVHGYVATLQSYLQMGRFDLAWPSYLKAMDSDPDDFELWGHAAYFAELVGAKGWPDPYMLRAIELGAGEPTTLKAQIHIHMLRGEFDAALAIAREALAADLDDRWFSLNMFLRMLRDEALRSNSYADAVDAYRENRPALFEPSPGITVDNIGAAADLALLLQVAGEPDRAGVLIDAGLEWYEENVPTGVYTYGTSIVAAHLFALKGEGHKALSVLQDAVDKGWAYDWFWHINNRDLDSIRDAPEFQKIVADLEANMAAQLAVIEALPDMGPLDLRHK